MTLLGLPAVTGSYFRPEINSEPSSAPAGAGNTTVSWPLYLTGHTLHTSTDLTAPSWTAVPGAPTEAGGNFQLTVPSGDARRFWSLRPPQ
jgi:hypothetical protein